MNTKKTLADAKHGGCVQLPTSERERFEAWAESSGEGLSRWPDGLYVRQATQVAWDAWQAALAAQPSPGGQGDERAQFSEWWSQQSCAIGTLLPYEIARLGWDGALAARQLEGEPVEVEVPQGAIINGAAFADRLERAYQFECPAGPLANCTDYVEFRRCFDYLAQWASNLPPLYAVPPAQPPAQAVDLPYPLDADPAGIRARVADVITGTLMVGAQGHTPPPAGHWAEPFWQAARADATAKAVDLPAFKALYRAYVRLLESARDRIIDLGGTCDPVDVMEANDIDLQAARRVLDSQAAGK